MVIEDVENIVIVDGASPEKPVGVARAADILRLRRWQIEEEGPWVKALPTKTSAPPTTGAKARSAAGG